MLFSIAKLYDHFQIISAKTFQTAKNGFKL